VAHRLGANIGSAPSQLNAIAIIAAIICIVAGVASENLGMKIGLIILGIVVILATVLGFVSSIADSLGVHAPFARRGSTRRKRNLCPKCLGPVKTVVKKDKKGGSGFQYWCARCKEAVPVPTTSKRLQKVRFEKRGDLSEEEE
jgi:hypothetical protein